MGRNATRNSDGTFARRFFVPWDGSNWDEGYLHRKGYFMVYRPDHPAASPMGMVRRHHVIWWLATGEVIVPGEQALHHKNEIKTDDRLVNLQKMTHGEHTHLHFTKPLVDCVCRICGRHFGLPKWRVDEGRGKVCGQQCWQAYKRGEHHPRAVLSAEQVAFIRASNETGASLARQLGVSDSVISGVRRRQTYA